MFLKNKKTSRTFQDIHKIQIHSRAVDTTNVLCTLHRIAILVITFCNFEEFSFFVFFSWGWGGFSLCKPKLHEKEKKHEKHTGKLLRKSLKIHLKIKGVY